MDESETFDPAALERLRKLGGDKFAAEMIDLFLDYVAKKVAEARQALNRQAYFDIATAAHPIKSSAGNVGALLLQKLAAEAEATAKTGQSAGAGQLVAALEQAFAEIKPRLESERAKLMAKPS